MYIMKRLEIQESHCEFATIALQTVIDKRLKFRNGKVCIKSLEDAGEKFAKIYIIYDRCMHIKGAKTDPLKLALAYTATERMQLLMENKHICGKLLTILGRLSPEFDGVEDEILEKIIELNNACNIVKQEKLFVPPEFSHKYNEMIKKAKKMYIYAKKSMAKEGMTEIDAWLHTPSEFLKNANFESERKYMEAIADNKSLYDAPPAKYYRYMLSIYDEFSDK